MGQRSNRWSNCINVNMSGEPTLVGISQLSLPQLDQVKSKLEDDAGTLTVSMQQLKAVQQRLKESRESLGVFRPESDGKSILVPLTGSMYVPGKLKDTDRVLVDVGTGYYVEKTIKEAEEFFQRKEDYVTKNLEKLQQVLIEKRKFHDAVLGTMQAKMLARPGQ